MNPQTICDTCKEVVRVLTIVNWTCTLAHSCPGAHLFRVCPECHGKLTAQGAPAPSTGALV